MTQGGSAHPTHREFLPGDEPAVLRLLNESLGERGFGRRTPALWSWKHMQNPFGRSLLRVACDSSGQIIGLRAFMRWRLRIGTTPVHAVQAVDTATSPAHRRRGIFMQLTREMVNIARAEGVQLIFNTPNKRSRGGYQKLGWTDAGALPPMIFIPRPAEFCRRLMQDGLRSERTRESLPAPAPLAKELFRDREGLARLLVRTAETRDASVVTTDLSVDFLHWRYTRIPNLQYRVIVLPGSENPSGVIIFREGVRLGLNEVLLSDMFLSHPDPRLCWSLLEELRSRVRADYILAYFQPGSLLAQALGRYGFHAIPARALTLLFETPLLRWKESQKPRRLMVKLLDVSLSPALLSRMRWSFTMGDLEIF